MKNISKLLFAIILITAFTACKKIADLPHYANGAAPKLSASATTIAPTAADSSKTVLTLTWSNPKYATDSSHQKFIVEMDSAGRNFANEVTFEVDGPLSYSFTGNQLNNILANFGFTVGNPFNVDIRLTSSYANNNEQYKSNVITVKMTSYIVPITLVASSTNPLVLLITNAANTAVSFNWNASKYGTNTIVYGLEFDTAGGNFAAPQFVTVNTALTGAFTVSDLNSFAILAGIAPEVAKNMEFRVAGFLNNYYSGPRVVFSNVITINITPYVPFLYLYVPGDYQGWSPGTAPTIGATSPNLNSFEGYVNVAPGGTYEFKINTAPDWNHTSYGDGGGGTLSVTGGNLKWPSNGGYYLLHVDYSALTWSATPTTWAIIGDATPNGWGGDTPMMYDAINNVWVINNVPLTAGGHQMKFRANGAWNINLGGDISSLSYGGGNISINADGNYKIVLDLSHPLKYTTTITKL